MPLTARVSARRCLTMLAWRSRVRAAASSSRRRKWAGDTPASRHRLRARPRLERGASSPNAALRAAISAASAWSSGSVLAGGRASASVGAHVVLVRVGGIESSSKTSTSIGFTWCEESFTPPARDPSSLRGPAEASPVPVFSGLFCAVSAHSNSCSASLCALLLSSPVPYLHDSLSGVVGVRGAASAAGSRPSSHASPSTAAKNGRRS